MRFCENRARFCENRARFCELSYAVIARLAYKSWQSIFKKWIATTIRFAHFLAMTKFKQILRFSFVFTRDSAKIAESALPYFLPKVIFGVFGDIFGLWDC
ncbi:hypothetical protein [Helicobacter sp. 23-1045]